MQDSEFSDIVLLICKEDSRFNKRAYDFVRFGLDYTVKEGKKREKTTSGSRHVSGKELLDGLRLYALDQYGPMAKTVLNNWGVKRCRDFGDIVFNLIDYKVFSKNDSDKPEDFDKLYDFDEAFIKPYLPQSKPRLGISVANMTKASS
jgi:uncharacterized repeat protein (TIGR04138 family)